MRPQGTYGIAFQIITVLRLVFALVLIFIVVYAAVALEHPLKIGKSATALFGAGLLWTVYALSVGDHARLGDELDETVTATARITFFLLGAMTIVEVIDAHDGFAPITARIRTQRLVGLLWLVGWITFFLRRLFPQFDDAHVLFSTVRKAVCPGKER